LASIWNRSISIIAMRAEANKIPWDILAVAVAWVDVRRSTFVDI
jgi:hypothetical protein